MAEAERSWAEIHLARRFLAVSNPSEHVVAAVREEPAQRRRREAPAGGVLAEGRGHRRQGHPNKVSKLSNELCLLSYLVSVGGEVGIGFKISAKFREIR